MGNNKKHVTFADHEATAKRIQLVNRMLSPLVAELTQDFGSKSAIGKAAARLTGSGSVLSALTDQMEKTWHAEAHDREGHANPYDDR